MGRRSALVCDPRHTPSISRWPFYSGDGQGLFESGAPHARSCRTRASPLAGAGGSFKNVAVEVLEEVQRRAQRRTLQRASCCSMSATPPTPFTSSLRAHPHLDGFRLRRRGDAECQVAGAVVRRDRHARRQRADGRGVRHGADGAGRASPGAPSSTRWTGLPARAQRHRRALPSACAGRARAWRTRRCARRRSGWRASSATSPRPRPQDAAVAEITHQADTGRTRPVDGHVARKLEQAGRTAGSTRVWSARRRAC